VTCDSPVGGDADATISPHIRECRVFGTAPSAPNGGYLRAKVHDSIVCF